MALPEGEGTERPFGANFRLLNCMFTGFVPNVSHVFALKGRSILAQGNALGTTDNIDLAALKGQGNTDRPEGEDRNTVPLPLQGG